MVYVLEWMEKPEGKRYRFWNTVSDCYACEETDEAGAADVLRAMWERKDEIAGRPENTTTDFASLIRARSTEETRVEAWAKIAWCGECGGQWYDQPVECCGKIWEPI